MSRVAHGGRSLIWGPTASADVVVQARLVDRADRVGLVRLACDQHRAGSH